MSLNSDQENSGGTGALLTHPDGEATPGKLAFEIKVTTLDGERIGFGRAVGRLLGKLVSSMILWIGYLMALFTSHRQTSPGNHDDIMARPAPAAWVQLGQARQLTTASHERKG